MTRHLFLIVDKKTNGILETNEVIERDTTSAYGEWVGVLWAHMIHLYDTGRYKHQKLVLLAPNPEDYKTITDEQIERFCLLRARVQGAEFFTRNAPRC